MKSPGLRAREEQLSERIQEAEQRGQGAAFMEALKGTVTDPALLGGAVVESIPAMLPALGLGAAVARTTTQRALAKGAEAAAARAAGATAGVGTAKGVGAVQQGAEVGAESYKQLFDEFRRQGLDEPEAAKRTLNAARAAGASGAIISYLAQSLPGASALEEAIITGQRRVLGRVGAGIAGGLKEAPSEAIEEGGGRATQNVALREAIPDQPISAGVGEAAGRAAAAGLGLGAGVGAIQRGPARPAPQVTPPPPPPAGPQGAPPAPPSGQGELFTEAEAPRAPTPEGLAQNKAYYDALNNQLTQLTREQETLRTQASQTSDPAAQEQLRQQSVAVTEQIANVSGEMARYAPTIPSIAQEPRIDTEARAEEAERTADLQAKRQEFDTLQRENERLKTEYERASALEDRVQRVRETMRIRAEAERLAPSLAALQEDIQRDRRALPTQATQRAPTAEGQLDLRFGDEIRLEDLTASGIPVEGGTNQQRAVRSWFRDNVIGKTPNDLRAMVAKDPSLTDGTGLRARAIQQILAPEPTPPAFEEKPRAPVSVPPANVPAAPVQPELDFGGAGAGVEVSGRAAQPAVPAGAPAQPQAAQPGGLGGRGVPAAPRAGEPAAPSGQLDLDFTAAPATAPAPTPPTAPPAVKPTRRARAAAPAPAPAPVVPTAAPAPAPAPVVPTAAPAPDQEAPAKRKAAAEAKRAEAEARKAEADARKAEEEARQAEEAAKRAEDEAKQRDEDERTRRVEETARKGQLKQAGAKWREYADPDTQPKWADLSDEQKERWREAIEAGRPTIALAEEIAPAGRETPLEKRLAKLPKAKRQKGQISFKPISQATDVPPEQKPTFTAITALMNPNGGTSSDMGQSATDFVTKFRTRIADKGATALEAISKGFNGAVRNALGQASLEPLYRQAEASDQLIPAYLRLGSLAKDKATGLWRAVAKPNLRPPADVLSVIETWAKSQNMSFQKAYDEAGKIMESARQKEFKDLNASMAKGREFPVSMSDADINKYYGIYSSDPTFHRTLRKILDDARFDLIDNMVKVGRIPQEMADDWKTATAYIPFDREGVAGLEQYFRSQRKLGRGIAQMGKANPQLVDAPLIDRPVKNALDNYFNWMGWGVRQVVQADATIRTLRALEKVGQARFLPGGAAQVNSNNKPRVVQAYVKGDEVYFETPSAYHAAAFNIQIAPLPALFEVMGKFSQVLRTAITAVPTFTATQVPQDIQRAIMYSGVKDAAMLTARTLTNFTEYSKAAVLGKLPQITHELGEYGVVGDFDFRMDEAADSFLRSMGVKPRRGGAVGEFVYRMSDIARASDFALRRAIYEQTLYEGGDQLLALHRAREIINFRRYGMGDQLGVVHMLTQVIPFYGAYIQGMDVLYRSLTGKDAPSGQERGAALKQFYTSAAYVTSVAVLYSLAKAGDEEYENMDLRERDKTWVIGDGFGIPVPGELGMIFKALPERVLEAMRKQGTPDEAVAAEAVISWFKAAFDEYSGRGYMPASFKPLLENITNYSFLSGRALEGTYQAGLLPSERTTSRTSELSKNIARFTADTTGFQVSPIKIDNFLQGYLGTTAGLLFATTDAMLNPDRIDRPLHQMVGLTAFTYDPVGTRRASEFYDLREKVVQTQNTLNSLMKEDLGRAADFAEKNADKLMLYKAVNSTLKEIERTRAYRNWLSSSDAAQSLTQKERAQQMEEIKRYEQQMFEWTRDVRNYLKL